VGSEDEWDRYRMAPAIAACVVDKGVGEGMG